jgi:hypothetical protein
MELAAHWHRCQNLQKKSDYFLQQYSRGEMILSSGESSSSRGYPGDFDPLLRRFLDVYL